MSALHSEIEYEPHVQRHSGQERKREEPSGNALKIGQISNTGLGILKCCQVNQCLGKAVPLLWQKLAVLYFFFYIATEEDYILPF